MKQNFFNLRLKYLLLIIVLLIPLFVLFKENVFAQNLASPPKEEILEAKIEKVLEEKQIVPEGLKDAQLYQKLELLVTKGTLKDKKIIVENGNLPVANSLEYKVNDKVIVTFTKNLEGKDVFYITDYIRRDSLLFLFLIFVVLAVVVAKKRGLASLIGMAFSFLVIFLFILPMISSGNNPVEIAILGSLVIIPVTFFLSHGVNKKTIVAIIGTIIALIIAGVLASFFVEGAKLTGFASEEASFLSVAKQGVINMKNLLLAGIIIGLLGILDDITISQSAIVFQLKETDKKLCLSELYKKAMNVGQDHISSMINTLVLVYTGASLSLLLLFTDNPRPFLEVINYEIIADQIIRVLIGSIGLILAVPITTFIAALVADHNSN